MSATTGYFSFQEPIDTPVPAELNNCPTQVATGDLNGNGLYDVVVGSCINAVAIFLSNGDGTLAAPTVFVTAAFFSRFSDPETLALAVFDTDGNLDIAVANQRGGTVSLIIGNGDGTFQSPVELVSDRGRALLGVVAADFDRNGLPDLAVSDQTAVVHLFLNQGGTAFTASRLSVGTGPLSPAAGDLNGDGLADLAVPDDGDGMLRSLLGDGAGGFTEVAALFIGTVVAAVALADIDRDGDLDLVGTTADNALVTVALGNGDGAFAQPSVLGEASVTTTPWVFGPAIADLDSDGILDIARPVSLNGQNVRSNVIGFRGLGGGTFAPPEAFMVWARATAVAAGDLNGDSGVDLVVATGDGREPGLLSVLLAITPTVLIQSLIAEVEALDLNAGIENSLNAKLDAAMQALDDPNANNDAAAINSLQAFINAVEAQRVKDISAADADNLIAAAQEIIAVITAAG